jgi:hypothetical protein
MKPARDPDSPRPDSSTHRRGFIIQIDGRPTPLAMSDVVQLLHETGVELDTDYGPVPVNPALGRFVVRGIADDEARRRAEAIPGVRLFADPRVEPAP